MPLAGQAGQTRTITGHVRDREAGQTRTHPLGGVLSCPSLKRVLPGGRRLRGRRAPVVLAMQNENVPDSVT